MPGFDYANARLRAMKSRLLPREELAVLADEADLEAMLNALTRTPYRKAAELALVRHDGLTALTRTLQVDMDGRLKKIERFFTGKTADLVQLVLIRYDVDNLKAVLRGLSQQLPAEEILAATLSRGTIVASDLTQLAQAANAREAIDLLATWRFPIAQPLLALRVEKPGAALWQMETALEQWYFDEVEAEEQKAGRALRDYLGLYADCTNMMTVIRLVGQEGRAIFFRRQFDAANPLPLLIGPGKLPFRLLVEAAQEETVQEAVSRLDSTTYGRTLAEALGQYRSTGRISIFERALHRLRLRQAASFFVRDPHGIGILLGYLFLSGNELANLRRVGQGIYLRRPTAEIQADLLFADR